MPKKDVAVALVVGLVLLDCQIDGVDYRCGSLVSLPADLAKAHKDQLDTNEEAVQAWIEAGEAVIEHPVAQAQAQAEGEEDPQKQGDKNPGAGAGTDPVV